jgi:hypothetical protein
MLFPRARGPATLPSGQLSEQLQKITPLRLGLRFCAGSLAYSLRHQRKLRRRLIAPSLFVETDASPEAQT